MNKTLIQPDYIRYPVSGEREPYTGLTRGALENLVQPRASNNFNPPVQSKLMRITGQKRWIRLIIYQSLLDYLAQLPSTGIPYHRKKVKKVPFRVSPKARRAQKEAEA